MTYPTITATVTAPVTSEARGREGEAEEEEVVSSTKEDQAEESAAAILGGQADVANEEE